LASNVFNEFARAGPIGWKVIWKLTGPVLKPSPPVVVVDLKRSYRNGMNE